MTDKMTSTKPYIVRAFYDWISDNELTPYIVADVSVYGVIVPMAFVNDGQITLNISSSAVGAISMLGDQIEFSARFAGKLEHLVIPYGAVAAIYAKENGAGTQLPIEHPEVEEQASSKTIASELKSVDCSTSEKSKAETKSKSEKSRPSLKVIK
ncbi:ClpXP protease specificity-enhancing factor [Thalassotalea profundi]|uniref:Stringent starvation protein B n=1 Tax=Thalassotalea profundi TaxID=2036687 RepID=A0ABQ3IHW9_9GAMM|nr:ClpXP protease specificity-enhancing factor [Thalassotalea profundi]GHE81943.1 stringent starvation protein B [Thalassotalea profundi]